MKKKSNTWQDWIERENTTIFYWAKCHHYTEYKELVAHFILYVEKNWSKFSKIPDGIDRIKWMNAWFKNNVNWKNSDFRRSITYHESPQMPELSDFEQAIELMAEDLSEANIDLTIDLTEQNFNQLQIEKILCVREVYKELSPQHQVLYDLYFEQMMSLRKIAKKIGIPMSSVYSIFLELKKEILEKC